MITLENKKVHDYIVIKDKLVWDGRKISQDIENLEKEIKVFEEKEKKITGKVIPPKELTDKGDAVAKQIGSLSGELDSIAKQINDSKLAAVPKEMKDSHMALLKQKEKLERERNKIALKVQKIKDKLIPIVQKEVTPFLLDKFDDIETAKAKGGKVVISTFNHLEEFKKRFNR